MISVTAIQEEARKLRRQREALSISLEKARLHAARAQAILNGQRVPPAVTMARVRLETLEAGGDLDPLAYRYRKFCSDLFQRLRLDVSFAVQPGAKQGYAWAALRRIEIEEIHDIDAFLATLHEVAHITVRCEPPRHHPTNAGLDRKVCVRCELDAWRQAVEWIVASGEFSFRREMHGVLSESLGTYTQFATPDERVEIRRMCGDMFQKEALCRCLTR